MIKDWNRREVNLNEVFHFQHSLRPFIYFVDSYGFSYFLELDKGIAYDLNGLEYEGLFFYRKEEDEDFFGVEVDGKIEWVEEN